MKLSIFLLALPISATSAYTMGGPRYRRNTMRSTPTCETVPCGDASVFERRDRRRQKHFREKMQQQQEWLNRAFDVATGGPFAYSTPSFQVLSDDTASIVAVDVPGVPMEGIDIQIDDDERIMTVSGEREIFSNGESRKIKFSRTFVFDERARLEDLSATLRNGVLTVSAPKDPVVEAESKTRSIPIEVKVEENEAEAVTPEVVDAKDITPPTETTGNKDDDKDDEKEEDKTSTSI